MNCEIKFLRNTNGVFNSGSCLEATVEVHLTECVKINEINCKFSGIAKCEWAIDISRYNLQTYSGRVDCLDHKLNVTEHSVELTAGSHNFDFQYQLPVNLPTSYKSKYASIKYKLQIVVKFSSLTESELFFELPFVVIHPVNLNSITPSLNEPIKVELVKNFNFNFAASDVNMMAVVPQGGYVAGQSIEVLVQCENLGRAKVKYVKIALRKICIMTCQKPKVNVKKVTENITKEVIYHEIPPKSRRDFLRMIFIPPIPPIIDNCEIINVSYELKVKAKTIGWNKSPAIKIPITIGTIAIVNESLIFEDNSLSGNGILPPSYEESFRNSAATDDTSSEDD